MEAIILCGGLGRRLKSEVPDLPKPMAPIGSRPFLDYLIEYLQLQGFTRIVLSIGYLHEKISDYFGRDSRGIEIDYVVEDDPKGTGGAIKLSLKAAMSDDVFILNGDTFVGIDYLKMLEEYTTHKSNIMMALRPVEDVSRYGNVVVDENVIVSFDEKGMKGPGLINAGVYLVKRSLLDKYNLHEKFSFEADFLSVYIRKLKPSYFITDSYFIDIGLPKSYRTAQKELAGAIKSVL
jgi:D-glycero-alpha-D-manno-heptose 1-phosphate guanylyltransferase